MRSRFVVFRDLCDGPFKYGAQVFAEHGAAGFADGRQSVERPVLRAALPRLAHQEGVHGEVSPLRPGGEQVAVAFQCVLHNRRKLDNPWYGCALPGSFAPSLLNSLFPCSCSAAA